MSNIGLKGSRVSCSSEETFSLGVSFALFFPKNTIFALYGDLAAGKTTFVKGLAQGTLGIDPASVQSPTYTYLHVYQEGKEQFFHFDLYRLEQSEQFFQMGFDEVFHQGVVCIEWAERLEDQVPPSAVTVSFSHVSETSRIIKWQ